MFVPRKPWPFGNEFHTIACAVSGILYSLELVEGKDKPRERPEPEFNELGKTVGLLLRLTQQLWGTGKVVVLDSGFCVLKGLIELKKKGVFAAALIKKRKYWPRYIDGERIKAHFADKPIGYADAIEGNLENVRFHIFGMKEEDYTMMVMSTYGTLERVGDEKIRRPATGETLTFKYPEVVHNHYQNRDAVDSHNARRQAPIALEETWQTTRWANRVFTYLLATSEVNANLAESRFGTADETLPQLQFRRFLARDLIHNPYLRQEDDTTPSRRSKRLKDLNNAHQLMKLPCGKKFTRDGRMVKSTSKYPFNFCICRLHRVRTFCKCSPGVLRCIECFATHKSESMEE